MIYVRQISFLPDEKKPEAKFGLGYKLRVALIHKGRLFLLIG